MMMSPVLHPAWLGLLLLLPLWWWVLGRQARKHGFGFGDLRAGGASTLENGRTIVVGRLPDILRLGAAACLICAIARPVGAPERSNVTREGIDLMLVVDTSDSMQAMDFEWEGQKRNRIEVAQRVLLKFVDERKDDRMGLVIFARNAFLQCPLTLDRRMVSDFLARLTPGMADGSGTAIGDGLSVAVKRLRHSDSKTRIIILMTDGSNNSGKLSPATATSLAKEFGVRVYTVGVGTKGEAPVPVDTPFGRQLVYQKVDIDEDLLTSIAKETGGQYFRATDTDELKQIYQTIDKLEKSRLESPEAQNYDERFGGWVWLALLFLFADSMLGLSVWRRLPA